MHDTIQPMMVACNTTANTPVMTQGLVVSDSHCLPVLWSVDGGSCSFVVSIVIVAGSGRQSVSQLYTFIEQLPPLSVGI